jgi:hypothetical protein
MELKDLVGEHELSGLDTFTKKATETWEEDSDGYRFVLDGKTYCALEDPSDGYRSNLRNLEITEDKVDYTFPPQKVIGKMREDEEYSKNDTIEFYDAINGKLILVIGTDNWDDYYPCCIMNWYPENLSINSN